jgi:glycosyltransferase involved in cell wall biosynthesis
MKKILIMIDTNVGGRGGAETHLWNLLRKVDPSLLKIEVIYFDSDKADINTTRERIRGVTYHRVPVTKLHSLTSLKQFKQIYGIMKSGNFDAVVSFFESSDIIAACLAPLAGIRMRISNRRDTGFLNSRKVEQVYRLINKTFTHFIAVSDAVKQSLVEQGVSQEKIHVVYNAVDTQRFHQAHEKSDIREELGISPQEIAYGMVANLNPVKNHLAVIESLKEIHSGGQAAHLILAGEGQLREELEAKVDELELSNHVHFIGSREDIENVLSAFDIFILASFTEGLSNALLEAMAAKKPVIASRVGGNIEVVEDGVNGFLVALESAAITAAMKKLYESAALRASLGEKALLRVESHFSLEKMVGQYMQILNFSDGENNLSKHTVSPL